MKGIRVVTLAILMGFAAGVHAKVEILSFSSEDHQERYNDLIQELRCLVCQNQNIADSNAELAVDLRRRTYEMVEAGKSESEIVDFMVTRYGDFVIYRPPVRTNTLMLWSGPFIILVVGIFILLRTIRRRAAAKVSEESLEQATLDEAGALLREQEEKDPQ